MHQPRSDHTIIIGAGLLGLSTALALIRQGEKVTVLDACEDVASGASHANGAMLVPSMSDPWNAPGVGRHLAGAVFGRGALKLTPRAIPSYLSWGLRFLRSATESKYKHAIEMNYRLAKFSVDATRAARDQFHLTYQASSAGTMKVFRECADMQASLAVTRSLQDVGLAYEVLDAQGAVNREPQLSSIRDRISGAIYYPNDECGDAFLFCRAVAERVLAAGGRIHLGTSVARIVVDAGAVTSVESSKGIFVADRVVVAAGSWSPALLRTAGVRLHVKPVKGYSVTFETDKDVRLPHVPVVDDAMHVAVVPLQGRLRMVGAAEFSGFDCRIDPERVTSLVELLSSLYPHLAAQADPARTTTWAGLRPVSADGVPFIGSTTVRGLYVNAGHGHLGWTMAVGSGELLADCIVGREPKLDLRPYCPVRLS